MKFETPKIVFPNEKQRLDYLLQLYFGGTANSLFEFISNRAYRDMCRTLKGAGKLSANDKNIWFEKIRSNFQSLKGKTEHSVDDFDKWHEECCDSLIQHSPTSSEGIIVKMTYGQAQKWINMIIKYCWVTSDKEFDWLKTWYSVAHIPIDSVISFAVKREKNSVTLPNKKWSQFDKDEYKKFQTEFRAYSYMLNSIPLKLEFDFWKKYRKQVTGKGFN